MKIENSVNSAGAPAPKETTSATGRAGTGAPAASGTSGGGDSVHLSVLSSQMQRIEARLANVPVVDLAQVNEIKQAMSEGRFKVNPEVVADKLIQTVRELIRNKMA
jgi:negative regulator of flagellin synthesis FlgM